MIKKLLRKRVFFALLILLISLSSYSVLASANSVPASHLSDSSRAITANDLKPPECASLDLTNVISDTVFLGLPSNSLVLGTAASDWVLGYFSGSNTNTCILGGGQGDWLVGTNGADIIIGGPGNDTINGRGGDDICYGNGGVDSFSNCEEYYQ